MSETNRGETVRSRAEKQVADVLHAKEIDYVYEQTITLGRKKYKIKYDFFLPKDDIYIEYWGLEGAGGDTGQKYIERKEEKIGLYNKYSLKLLSLYPEDLENLEDAIMDGIKEVDRRHRSILRRIGMYIKYALFGVDNPTDKVMDSDEKYFCTSCGTQLVASDDFCVNCGTKNNPEA